MKLILASFDGLFGLKGKISFAPFSPTILYGSNMAGKTNVITALRMCFWGHKIFSKNWLQKEEVILAPLTEGVVTCYFAQLNKFYKITYAFKRYGESVRRRCGLWSAPLTKFDASMTPEDLHHWLEMLDWEKGKEAAAPNEIKRHLEEIGIYPEIVENYQSKKVPIEDLILGKDDSGNWGIMQATNIFIPPEENEEPEPTPDEKDTSWWSDPVICAPAMQAMIDYMDENVLDSPGIFRNEPNISSGWGPYDREDNVVIVKGWMVYGTTSDIKEIEWTAMIDLNIYEVTWEWLT